MRKYTISFRNALTGIYTATHTQTNIRIHLIATILVLIISIYLQVTLIEGLILILTIATVFVAEMFNTALEFLSDAVTLEHNQLIGHAKDISAGAVLISAILALTIGLFIFIPKFI